MLRYILILRYMIYILGTIIVMQGCIVSSKTEVNHWLYFVNLMTIGVGTGAIIWARAKNIPTILTACKSKRIYQKSPAESINLNTLSIRSSALYYVWQIFPANGLGGDLLIHSTTDGTLPEYFMIGPEKNNVISLSWEHLCEMRACTHIANTFMETGLMDKDFMTRCANAQKTNEQKTAPSAS